jgi:hypothetical protein
MRTAALNDGGARDGNDAGSTEGNVVGTVRAHVARLHALIAQLNGSPQERDDAERAIDQLVRQPCGGLNECSLSMSAAADGYLQPMHEGCGAFERGRLDYITRREAQHPIASGRAAAHPLAAHDGGMHAPPARGLAVALAPAAPAPPWRLLTAAAPSDPPQRSSSVHTSRSGLLQTFSSDARRLRLATGTVDSGAHSVAVSQEGLEAYYRGRDEFNFWAARQRWELARAHPPAHLGGAPPGPEAHQLGYFEPARHVHASHTQAHSYPPYMDAMVRCGAHAPTAAHQSVRCKPVLQPQRQTGKGKRKTL